MYECLKIIDIGQSAAKFRIGKRSTVRSGVCRTSVRNGDDLSFVHTKYGK
nr:MAG TPA: hypothetical protein [Caudoviricetes sp.]